MRILDDEHSAMNEKRDFMKVLAKVDCQVVLTSRGLYERQVWPSTVEWWELYGELYNSAKLTDQATADYLESEFKEREL